MEALLGALVGGVLVGLGVYLGRRASAPLPAPPAPPVEPGEVYSPPLEAWEHGQPPRRQPGPDALTLSPSELEDLDPEPGDELHTPGADLPSY